MTEASRGLVASAERSNVGPDYFSYYRHEIVELLSEDENFLPFTPQAAELSGNNSGKIRGKETTERSCNGSSSFSSNIGAGLSDFKKERLRALLRQSVLTLTPEVDEMLDPVVAMRQLQSQFGSKKRTSNYVGSGSDGDAGLAPHKKLKGSSSSSATSISAHAGLANDGSCKEGIVSKDMDTKGLDAVLSQKGMSNVVQKNCPCCQAKKVPNWGTGADEKISCNACNTSCKRGGAPVLDSNICTEKDNVELDKDLQLLLESDSSQVEETLKKYSDELSATLGHMEKQLEELLDSVMSTCRPMALYEMQHLRKLIQKLPPKNLDRVVEIIQRNKSVKTKSCDEIFVNLEKEDNVTLWRLYYYCETVEKARILAQ